jgi:hypothetical protein
LFVGSLSSVDEQQVVALLEVINHEQPLTWASLALLSLATSLSLRAALSLPKVYQPVKASLHRGRGDRSI